MNIFMLILQLLVGLLMLSLSIIASIRVIRRMRNKKNYTLILVIAFLTIVIFLDVNIVYYISNFLVFEITRENYLGKSMIWYHRMKAEGDLFFLLINPLTLSFNIAVLIIDYLFRRKVNHT